MINGWSIPKANGHLGGHHGFRSSEKSHIQHGLELIKVTQILKFKEIG